MSVDLMLAGLSGVPLDRERAATLALAYKAAEALDGSRRRMRRSAIVRLAMSLGIWLEFQRACEEIDA